MLYYNYSASRFFYPGKFFAFSRVFFNAEDLIFLTDNRIAVTVYENSQK